jgi:hypothetical protein
VRGTLSLVIVVCSPVDVSATDRSFIQRNSSGCVQNCLLFLSDFNHNRKLLTNFRKGSQNEISLKSLRWKPSCCMRTGGRTHVTLPQCFTRFELLADGCGSNISLQCKAQLQVSPKQIQILQLFLVTEKCADTVIFQIPLLFERCWR